MPKKAARPPDHAAKRPCYSQHASDSAGEGRRRSSPRLIDDLVAQPAFLYGFQTCLKQLEVVFPSRYRLLFASSPLHVIGISFGSLKRRLLIAQGRLCTLLVQRLLRVPGQRALLRALTHATSVVARRHICNYSSATCVATLQGHSSSVSSVAFHPTAPLLATGGRDNTVKLWRLSSNNSSATCVATLRGHSDRVSSVAFHPTAPLLATGSLDNTAKLWRLSSDNSSATCVATLEGHSRRVSSVGHSDFVLFVAFHPTAPLLATCSRDNTAKLWRLSSNNSSATCVATLTEHSGPVCSVAFHPTAPLLATCSRDNTVKMWRLSSNNSSATCVATLQGRSEVVSVSSSVAFHPTAPFLATCSEDNTVKLWRLSSDNSSATCVATLEGHGRCVSSVAFHPTAPLLATCSSDCVKLWQ
jgi:WD40 repeat protein